MCHNKQDVAFERCDEVKDFRFIWLDEKSTRLDSISGAIFL